MPYLKLSFKHASVLEQWFTVWNEWTQGQNYFPLMSNTKTFFFNVCKLMINTASTLAQIKAVAPIY